MRRMTIVLAFILSLAVPTIAAACGAFIPYDKPVRQDQERMIFAVDSQANEITAYVQMNYTGEATQFAWILPVPNNPKIDTSELDFDTLQSATEPNLRFPSPPQACMRPPGATGGAPDGRGPEVVQQGSVGPYDYSVLKDSDPNVVVQWLQENDYQIQAELAPRLKLYSDQGMLFLAMKLQDDRTTGDIKPVMITYSGTKMMIPLRLASLATEPILPVYAWIFADQKAIPETSNYFLMRPNDLAITNTDGKNNYKELRSGVLASVKGNGWMIEYAQPTSKLQVSDPVVQTLVNKHKYVTRLYTELSRDDLANLQTDPTFKLEPSLQDVSNEFDFRKRDNPYYCEGKELMVRSVRDQQINANENNQPTSEEVTANLKRGPLRIGTLIVVFVVLGLIWWLSRGKRRSTN